MKKDKIETVRKPIKANSAEIILISPPAIKYINDIRYRYVGGITISVNSKVGPKKGNFLN